MLFGGVSVVIIIALIALLTIVSISGRIRAPSYEVTGILLVVKALYYPIFSYKRLIVVELAIL